MRNTSSGAKTLSTIALSSRAVLRCAMAAVLFGVSAPLAAQLAADDLGASLSGAAATYAQVDEAQVHGLP